MAIRRSLPRFLAGFVALFLVLAVATAADAQTSDRAGQVKRARGDVTLVRAGERMPAAPGTYLFQDDVIETGADGAVGMTFTDESRITLGPGSRMVVEAYRYDASPGASGNAFDTRLSRGSLTAVSGEVAKTPLAMRVLMPTGVLGVRGTQFAVRVAGQ